VLNQEIVSANCHRTPERNHTGHNNHEFQPLDPTDRMNSCIQILHSFNDGKIDSHLILFYDKPWFHLKAQLIMKGMWII
jgi:hypothetical protein